MTNSDLTPDPPANPSMQFADEPLPSPTAELQANSPITNGSEPVRPANNVLQAFLESRDRFEERFLRVAGVL